MGDKFNGNIIFDISGHSEVLKDKVITITRTIINCVYCIQMVLTFKTPSSSSTSIICWQTKSNKELMCYRRQASTWTIDGKIFCTKRADPDGKRNVLTCPDDLFKQLGWGEDKLKKSGLFVDV